MIFSIDNRCYLKVTSYPNNLYTRTASWHDIWEAAIIVNAMCIRSGKNGTFKVHLAGESRISLEVGKLWMIYLRFRYEPPFAPSRDWGLTSGNRYDITSYERVIESRERVLKGRRLGPRKKLQKVFQDLSHR